jgi:uncharacterized membrane protein
MNRRAFVSNGFAKARAWLGRGASQGALTTVATIGAVAAGAALIEAALIPGLAIGATVLLAPKIFRAVRRSDLAKAGRRAAKFGDVGGGSASSQTQPSLWSTVGRLRPGRTLMKTVTFRVVVTALDFSANYIVIGELATAAGLSAFSFVAGPVFYFLHEAGWNYFGDRTRASRDPGEHIVFIGLPMSQALAKTITYRTAATISEFSVNYVVVQNLATAALLSSFGVVLGPFVYFAHERAWEMFSDPERAAAPLLALPNPAAA